MRAALSLSLEFPSLQGGDGRVRVCQEFFTVKAEGEGPPARGPLGVREHTERTAEGHK